MGKGGQIKARMNFRLEELGYSLPDLAEATGESYRNVHRWVREDIRVPAHFLALFAQAVPVDARWLLTGEGSSDPDGRRPDRNGGPKGGPKGSSTT